METKLGFEELKSLLPEKTYLYYVDYGDSLEHSLGAVQKSISGGDWEAIDEAVWDAFDSTYEQEDYYLDELKKDLVRQYDMDRDGADELVDEYEEDLRDVIRDRDHSTPIEDLISNTGRLIAHYDTGYYMESGSWSWSDKEVYQEMQAIKKHLGIRSKQYNKDIEMMVMQASGGGSLLIYFELDIEQFLASGDFKTIVFKDAHIGVVNHYEGSGDICELPGSTIKLPFERGNVFLEESIKYNWTYSIAGMCRDWCESTKVELIEAESKRDVVVEESPTVALNKKEEEYNKTFKSGSCTFGDMDIRRHRNTPYINDYPCGNKCVDCGTFWID
jgi:hypothetical protein